METTPVVYQSASDLEISDIEVNTRERSGQEPSRVLLKVGLVTKSKKFILPADNLIQYKILYKTNADCNNYWHEIFGDNKPFKEDKLSDYYDGAKAIGGYDTTSPRVAFEVTIPSGQIATFRVLARVFQPSSGKPNVSVSALPSELLETIFSYLSFDECREYASSVCKAWRSAMYGYNIALPGVLYVDPKESTYKAADGGTSCWRIQICDTPSSIPSTIGGRYLQWQSSEIYTSANIYSTFLEEDPEAAAVLPSVVTTYKMYANSALLKVNRGNDLIPVDVRGKLSQCGVYTATSFVFCKPIAPNSIVVSVITVKQRRIQPIEVIPTDKFATLIALLQKQWPSIKPHEMKFKLRHNGKRLDVSHSDQSFAQLGITNFSWLHLDMSHPDVIPINVYQIDNKVITITIKSTMTRKSFREKVHQVTGTDSSKSYIVNLEGNDDEPIGQTYSKENHLFKENICFVFENAKATRPFEYLPIGSTWGRQVEFDIDVAADIFHKYLIALGVCGVNNRLRKRGGRYFDMAQSLRENGIAGQFDRVDILL
eukprot:TRINITY_DN430_c0_g1_i3.p1 TRINITY_DN430_c0_g1~~TRINITY_DN430_c0_g1_i3.p1  ORF type:complete len:550 (+),score=86.20 TRINITY_DN430_c0_g1_i3:29-1651(+)